MGVPTFMAPASGSRIRGAMALGGDGPGAVGVP